MLQIDLEACNGCKLCVKTCPFAAIIVENKKAKVLENCNLCGACVNVCPQYALNIERPATLSQEELAKYEGVCIFAECETQNESQIKPVVLQLLEKGRILADKLEEDLSVILLGAKNSNLSQVLISYRADKVYLCQHPLLEKYSTDSFTNVITGVIMQENFSIILFGATPTGRDLAPRIAARLKVGLTADCTGLDINEDRQLVQTRPAFGGNIMASILSPYTRPQLATVRPNVFPKGNPNPERIGTIKEVPVKLNPKGIRTKIIKTIITQKDETIPIDEADILVSAGRGIQTKENLELINKLAEELKGTMSCSRSLVDQGWLPHSFQVGQSGKTVNPKLYIALGISGAIQHLVGMSSSDVIIAINKDPDAPIFKIADFGIVGDVLEIVPILINRLRELKKN
jgi:electron transfer flavoprotein alpha subunit/NAD-dependent dihydropyrimidine dehydrogenase PreA subunit